MFQRTGGLFLVRIAVTARRRALVQSGWVRATDSLIGWMAFDSATDGDWREEGVATTVFQQDWTHTEAQQQPRAQGYFGAHGA